jgi:hypothetical protein
VVKEVEKTAIKINIQGSGKAPGKSFKAIWKLFYARMHDIQLRKTSLETGYCQM